MCKGIAAHSNTLYIILREIKLGQLHKRIIITEVSADDSEGFNLIFGAVTSTRSDISELLHDMDNMILDLKEEFPNLKNIRCNTSSLGKGTRNTPKPDGVLSKNSSFNQYIETGGGKVFQSSPTDQSGKHMSEIALNHYLLESWNSLFPVRLPMTIMNKDTEEMKSLFHSQNVLLHKMKENKEMSENSGHELAGKKDKNNYGTTEVTIKKPDMVPVRAHNSNKRRLNEFPRRTVTVKSGYVENEGTVNLPLNSLSLQVPNRSMFFTKVSENDVMVIWSKEYQDPIPVSLCWKKHNGQIGKNQ